MSEPVLDVLRAAASTVEAAVRAVPLDRRGTVVGMGADGEPTTLVDKTAEDAVVASLRAAPWPVTLLSEEAGVFEVRPGPSPILVLADPVDSTVNACQGVPIYTTCLSAHRDGVTVAALVRNLASGEVYEADAEGARLDGRAVRVRELPLEKVIVSFGPVAEGLGQRALLTMVGEASGVRLLACPSLSLAQVGTGGFGAFLGLGRSKTGKSHRLFDVLAAAYFVIQAGGVVTDDRGGSLPDRIDDLTASTMVVGAPPELHARLMEILATL